MFHSFHVMVNDAVIEAEEFKKIGKQFVPVGNLACQRFPGGSQNEAAIFFVFEEAVAIKPLDHVGHAGLRDFQARGDIDDARVSFRVH